MFTGQKAWYDFVVFRKNNLRQTIKSDSNHFVPLVTLKLFLKNINFCKFYLNFLLTIYLLRNHAILRLNPNFWNNLNTFIFCNWIFVYTWKGWSCVKIILFRPGWHITWTSWGMGWKNNVLNNTGDTASIHGHRKFHH